MSTSDNFEKEKVKKLEKEKEEKNRRLRNEMLASLRLFDWRPFSAEFVNYAIALIVFAVR